jgi:hypothetical protein
MKLVRRVGVAHVGVLAEVDAEVANTSSDATVLRSAQLPIGRVGL